MKTISRIILPVLILQITGCATLGRMDLLSRAQDAEKAISIAKKTGEAIRPMSEEEEYYLGRAVAAMILGRYQLYSNNSLEHYLNLVGNTVVMSSDRPYTYGGYHFAILDTDEINAFACPGGIIFITLGMLKNLRDEEELAGVLAHEVAHVSLRHGVSAIKASRWADVVMIIGTEAARRYSPSEVGRLLTLFEGSIEDVFKTIVVNGYGRDQEMAADTEGITYLYRAGYDPEGLYTFLNRLMVSSKSSGGILKTHPGTGERIDNVNKIIKEKGWKGSGGDRRKNRFVSTLRLLKV